MTNVTENYNKAIDKQLKWQKLRHCPKTEMANNTIRYATVHSHLMLESFLIPAPVFLVCPQGQSQAIVFCSASLMSNLWQSGDGGSPLQKFSWPVLLYRVYIRKSLCHHFTGTWITVVRILEAACLFPHSFHVQEVPIPVPVYVVPLGSD